MRSNYFFIKRCNQTPMYVSYEVNRIGKTLDMKMNTKKTKTMLVYKDVGPNLDQS